MTGGPPRRAHQASCVALGGRGLLIEGPPGSGKSSLALALIDRGWELVGDDGVWLEPDGAVLRAHPPPHIAGKVEIRNVGIVALPARSATIALVLALDPVAPRLPDRPERANRVGIALPLIRLWPDSFVLALRAEWALREHGLP